MGLKHRPQTPFAIYGAAAPPPCFAFMTVSARGMEQPYDAQPPAYHLDLPSRSVGTRPQRGEERSAAAQHSTRAQAQVRTPPVSDRQDVITPCLNGSGRVGGAKSVGSRVDTPRSPKAIERAKARLPPRTAREQRRKVHTMTTHKNWWRTGRSGSITCGTSTVY